MTLRTGFLAISVALFTIMVSFSLAQDLDQPSGLPPPVTSGGAGGGAGGGSGSDLGDPGGLGGAGAFFSQQYVEDLKKKLDDGAPPAPPGATPGGAPAPGDVVQQRCIDWSISHWFPVYTEEEMVCTTVKIPGGKARYFDIVTGTWVTFDAPGGSYEICTPVTTFSVGPFIGANFCDFTLTGGAAGAGARWGYQGPPSRHELEMDRRINQMFNQ